MRKKSSVEPKPNELLKQELTRRGWSYGRLVRAIEDRSEQEYEGQRLGPTCKTIGRWIKGKTYPCPFYQELLCLVFEKEAHELGLIPPKEQEHLLETDPPEVKALALLSPTFYGADQNSDRQEVGRILDDSHTFVTELDRSLSRQEQRRAMLPILRSSSPLLALPTPLFQPHRSYKPSRRRILLLAGVGTIILAVGTTAFVLQRENNIGNKPYPSPTAGTGKRQWPTIFYDPYRIHSVVRIIQWMLKDDGYLANLTDANGIFGPDTRDAVRQFRKKSGLPLGDSVESMIWEHLIRPSKRGDKGFHVMALQQQLNSCGANPPLALDTEFGPLTLRAVQDFRHRVGLPEKESQEQIADMDCWYHLVLFAVKADY